MKTLDLYTFIYNDEDFLPYFLEYYSFVDRMTFIDSGSTDKSLSILEEFSDRYNGFVRICQTGATWWDWDLLHPYRNQIWNDSKMDYILLPDCDEIFYHEEGLRNFLEKRNFDIYEMDGYEMVGELPEGSILKVNKGVHHAVYNKSTLFNPKVDIWFPSAHVRCSPSANVNMGEVKLLHYRNLGIDLMKKRRDRERARLPKGFRARTIHTDEYIENRFASLKRDSQIVI